METTSRNRTFRRLSLITATTLISLTSLQLISPANATSIDSAASYTNVVDYHASSTYDVPGELAFTNARINVRTGPGTNYDVQHYGLKGDRITILNQAWGKDGCQWWYLRFNESGAKGWVREDLVAVSI